MGLAVTSHIGKLIWRASALTHVVGFLRVTFTDYKHFYNTQMKKLLDKAEVIGENLAELIKGGLVVCIFFGILYFLGTSLLKWHGWIAEGVVNTNMCTTVVQLSPTTLERYYKSFTCNGWGECVHVDWNGSSCEVFTSNW